MMSSKSPMKMTHAVEAFENPPSKLRGTAAHRGDVNDYKISKTCGRGKHSECYNLACNCRCHGLTAAGAARRRD